MWETIINCLSRDPWRPFFPCSLFLFIHTSTDEWKCQTWSPLMLLSCPALRSAFKNKEETRSWLIWLNSICKTFWILVSFSGIRKLHCLHPGKQGPCTPPPCDCNFLWKGFSDLSNNSTGISRLSGEREGIYFEYGWSSIELHLNPACDAFIETWLRFFFFFCFSATVKEAILFCIQTGENLWNLWDKRAAWCQSGK